MFSAFIFLSFLICVFICLSVFYCYTTVCEFEINTYLQRATAHLAGQYDNNDNDDKADGNHDGYENDH